MEQLIKKPNSDSNLSSSRSSQKCPRLSIRNVRSGLSLRCHSLRPLSFPPLQFPLGRRRCRFLRRCRCRFLRRCQCRFPRHFYGLSQVHGFPHGRCLSSFSADIKVASFGGCHSYGLCHFHRLSFPRQSRCRFLSRCQC